MRVTRIFKLGKQAEAFRLFVRVIQRSMPAMRVLLFFVFLLTILFGALIFVGYILYDTSLLMHHLGPDDYIIAVVTLYLDVINLFLYLLELLRMLQGGDN